MKGRKSTPNALKSLRGTDQPVRLRNEINTEILTDVKPPVWLKGTAAKKIFKQKSEQLIKLKILSSLDIEQLAIYSFSLSQVIEAIKNINDEGNIVKGFTDKGHPKDIPNPYLKIYSENLDKVNKIGSEFGFTPVSRQKLSGQKDEPKGNNLENEIFG